MIVLTADQVSSRTSADLAGLERDRIQLEHGDRLLLPVARNAGDEIQMLTADARTAVDLVLELTRDGEWSVGVGVGSVREPLPEDIREASGDAFFAARDAVDRAKKSTPRVAIEADSPDTAHVEALFRLALILRERRSEQGWEVYDRLVAGASQSEIADALGVSAPAISARVKSANIRAELDAVPALARLLAQLDASTGARHA
ncbi:DNA-binding protein [Agromyces protaetiae]|uniref:DNA-binding protein n=1 Tax=Agromyces protaetiae TaxID=2509455 RepID=A0A4P6FEC7_9MICO|nr:DNA-binding protein [Agromyces protaetiae]QAY74284.1 DNA-binding protein [Agromyces protaetiae]